MEAAGRCGAAKGLHRMNISLKGEKKICLSTPPPSKAFVLQKAAGEASAEAKRPAPLPDRPPPSLSLSPSFHVFVLRLARPNAGILKTPVLPFLLLLFFFCLRLRKAGDGASRRQDSPFLLTVSDFYCLVFSPLPSTCAPLSLVEFEKKEALGKCGMFKVACCERASGGDAAVSSRLTHSASPFTHSARY